LSIGGRGGPPVTGGGGLPGPFLCGEGAEFLTGGGVDRVTGEGPGAFLAGIGPPIGPPIGPDDFGASKIGALRSFVSVCLSFVPF